VVPKSSLFPSVLLFSFACLWGLYWLPARHVEEAGLTGMWALVGINVIPLIVLSPLILWRWRVWRENFWLVCWIGLLTGLGMMLYATGLVFSSIMRATLIFYLTPMWATIFSRFMLHEVIDWRRWVAISLGLVGAGILLSNGNNTSLPLNFGDLAAVFAGISWGLGTVVIRRSSHIHPLETTTSQYVFGTLTAFVGLLIVLALTGQSLSIPALDVWVAATPPIFLFYVCLIVPGLFGIFWATKYLSPGRGGILMMSEVLVAAISAPLIAGEYLSLVDWFAASLIIAAAVLEVSSPTVALEIA